jgi:Na+/melibiose symporter-like transporter
MQCRTKFTVSKGTARKPEERRKISAYRVLALSLSVGLTFVPVAAQAYIGPGAGLGAIAVTAAVLLGLVLLLVGFLWFPLKRMMRKRKAGSEPAKTLDA